MRIIFLIVACLFASPALASDIKFPALTGRIVDTADQIPADQEAALDAELTAFEKAAGHQFVVVTIPDLGDIPNEDYEIGRASCRERVCQYVSITVVAVSLK